MFGFFGKKSREPTAAEIVPRIKHVNFLTAVKDLTAADPVSMPLTEPFAADLLITYAFDMGSEVRMFREIDRRRLALSLEQVRARSLENLQQQLGQVQQHSQPPVLGLSVGNHLEACLLLIDDIWRNVAGRIPGDIVAAVPSRDVLVLTSSESNDGLALLRDIARRVREQEPVHGLSEFLLTWRNGKWESFSSVQE